MMGKFRRLHYELELKELYLSGCRYMWSNEREHVTLERMDRVFYYCGLGGGVPLLLPIDNVLLQLGPLPVVA
jgi:hypothetical protein